MEMNVRTKIDINIVCACGNPLTIIYHKKWYGRYAIAVEPCEECSKKEIEKCTDICPEKNFKNVTCEDCACPEENPKSGLTSGDICDTIPNKEQGKEE